MKEHDFKKSKKGNFNVLQCTFDGTEVSELIGLYILYKINETLGIDNHCLCKDNGLMLVPDNRNVNDKIRKMFFKIFKSLDYEIVFDMNKNCPVF